MVQEIKLKKLYSIIDIETTGGRYNEEGITEIAIYKFDGLEITDQFITLVNPEIPIQPYVQELTGINNKMLINAPKFFEIAKRILEITDNTILVAHNSSFDFRMLKIEFRRLGFKFSIPTLCTVKLSKKLIPNKKSYKLGNLVKSLGIPISNRHRAAGDARATVELFKLLLSKDKDKTIINLSLNKETNLKKNKFSSMLENIENINGIYYLHDKEGKIIYIGKSKNIKNRVNQHLTGKSNKSLKIQLEINSITYERCGYELISILKEADEIIEHKPKFNKLLKKEILKFGLELCVDNKEFKFLRISHYEKDLNFLETYSSLKNANKRLSFIFEKYGIDDKKRNKINNSAIELFIKEISFPFKNMIIVDKGRSIDEKSIILIKESNYAGLGYFNLNYQITNYEILESLITPVKAKEIYNRIIINYLKKNNVEKIVNIEYLQ